MKLSQEICLLHIHISKTNKTIENEIFVIAHVIDVIQTNVGSVNMVGGELSLYNVISIDKRRRHQTR